MMYWLQLNEQNHLSLACDVYLAVLSIADEDGARAVCQDALERAGAHQDQAKQFAQQAHEWYQKTSADSA